MTKPSKQTKAADTEDEEVLVEGFTPEEEAALDAAAGKTGAVVIEKPATEAAAEVEDEAAGVDPDKELETLRQQVKDSNARADAAEAARKKLEDAQVAKIDDIEADELTKIKASDEKIAADLALAERDVTDLNRQLREAKENGDLDKEIEINDKLLDAKIEVKKIKGASSQFDTWKGKRKDFWDNERKKAEKATQRSEEPQLLYDPKELTPAALAWAKKHPEFGTDKKYNARAISAHYSAEAEGITVDTPEYFKFIEDKLGIGEQAATEVEDDPTSEAGEVIETEATSKVVAAKKKPASQLPPSRDNPGVQVRQNGTRIKKLTAAEAEAADISGMTPEEYWDSKYGNSK